MKKILICLLLLAAGASFAQTRSDSLAYNLQRKKINGMLDARRQKFGQYQESLSQHTGIFGLQTKKDIRHSNEILMDIVQTDDEIFRQLKILLDYRAFAQTQVQTRVQDAEGTNLNYMNTINRLRNSLDQAKKDAENAKAHQDNIIKMMFGILVLMFLSILFLISRKRPIKV
ncbi:hypothetical protein HQ865_09470 [Mucilaginibacter mali]|uniref:Uncharacterized protein n=1 Tax=Mucilaginibacter mali TaxID=2740462 RepID=A0A7D4TUU8_9SPHI|nr:hypothetical protein [Mucilaginibacter mali]QKJ29975.1 hypothetical protein HQ865_09470 [Mucilaginibacter mali]